MQLSIEKYRAATRALFEAHDEDTAAQLGVGGNYEVLGDICSRLLKMQGLTEESHLVDVGCGSGRLANALTKQGWGGSYLGTDISEELLQYARKKAPGEGFRFEAVDGLVIPAEDNSADMLCFFSVFTHLLHEESFVYLRDALRVAKPGGKIVVSYLDFSVPAHWSIFEYTVHSVGETRHHNVFMGRDLWHCWAEKMGFRIAFQQDGGVPFVPIDQPVTFDNGVTREGLTTVGPLGQSIIVLEK